MLNGLSAHQAMSLFKATNEETSGTPVSITHFDVSMRYDIYCSFIGEERLYEDVRITAIRTLDRITQYSSGVLGGFVEIEASSGARMMIPSHLIQMVCEHGAQPSYRVLRKLMPYPMEDKSEGK